MIKNRGYYIEKTNYSEEEIKKIKEELTVMPKVLEFGAKPAQDDEDIDIDPNADKKYKLYTNTKKYLILPRFYGQSKFGKTEIKIKDNPIDINFKGTLRDYQVPIVNLMEQHITKQGGGLLSVPCGRGKTLMAIYLITKLKLKTLVVVHKSFLLDQWIKSINLFTDAKTGTIRGNIIDTEKEIDSDIYTLNKFMNNIISNRKKVYDGFPTENLETSLADLVLLYNIEKNDYLYYNNIIIYIHL